MRAPIDSAAPWPHKSPSPRPAQLHLSPRPGRASAGCPHWLRAGGCAQRSHQPDPGAPSQHRPRPHPQPGSGDGESRRPPPGPQTLLKALSPGASGEAFGPAGSQSSQAGRPPRDSPPAQVQLEVVRATKRTQASQARTNDSFSSGSRSARGALSFLGNYGRARAERTRLRAQRSGQGSCKPSRARPRA